MFTRLLNSDPRVSSIYALRSIHSQTDRWFRESLLYICGKGYASSGKIFTKFSRPSGWSLQPASTRQWWLFWLASVCFIRRQLDTLRLRQAWGVDGYCFCFQRIAHGSLHAIAHCSNVAFRLPGRWRWSPPSPNQVIWNTDLFSSDTETGSFRKYISEIVMSMIWLCLLSIFLRLYPGTYFFKGVRSRGYTVDEGDLQKYT